MLGKPFFNLARALEAADSFESVATILSTDLPPLTGGGVTMILETCRGEKISKIWGKCEAARLMEEQLDQINQRITIHPLNHRVDLGDPGELGVAVSDFITPEQHRHGEFNRHLPEALIVEDSIVGKLSTYSDHTTLLLTSRWEGKFTPEEREIFDVILFIARAVIGRISGLGVDRAVQNFLMSTAGSPVALFVIRPNGEVVPISQHAVTCSEAWWAPDEPVRTLDPAVHDALCECLMAAWINPATAVFTAVELDLGGGLAACHALPKADGEILVFLPTKGSLPDGDEALKAILTRRQREIMEWVSEGKTSAETALILNISPRTVEKHLEAIFQRLGVENRISAVRRFLELREGNKA